MSAEKPVTVQKVLPQVGEVGRLMNGLGEPSGLVGMWTGERDPAGNYIISNVHPEEHPFHIKEV